uniref:Uncharacterized protein n=1 Tax=Arion vulgaris TaxID=1028688 RepID=A0A0B6ZF96_9EUPU
MKYLTTNKLSNTSLNPYLMSSKIIKTQAITFSRPDTHHCVKVRYLVFVTSSM